MEVMVNKHMRKMQEGLFLSLFLQKLILKDINLKNFNKKMMTIIVKIIILKNNCTNNNNLLLIYKILT